MEALKEKFGIKQEDRIEQAASIKQLSYESADEYIDRKLNALVVAGIREQSMQLTMMRNGIHAKYKDQFDNAWIMIDTEAADAFAKFRNILRHQVGRMNKEDADPNAAALVAQQTATVNLEDIVKRVLAKVQSSPTTSQSSSDDRSCFNSDSPDHGIADCGGKKHWNDNRNSHGIHPLRNGLHEAEWCGHQPQAREDSDRRADL